MSKNTYHEYLKAIPLFSDLDAHDLDVVGRAVTELSFSAGEPLIRQGTLAKEMFVVVEGEVEVTRDGDHVADIGPGGFAGELALLTHAPRNAAVSAKTDIRVLHIEGRSFDVVLEEAPQIAVKMLPVVAARAMDNADDDHG